MNLCSLKLPFFFEFKVRTLEKLRLSTWRKTPVNAAKEMKDGPSIPESSVPSVTKGVKFAVSLLIINYSTFSMVQEYELKNMVGPYFFFFKRCKLNQTLHKGKTVWE